MIKIYSARWIIPVTSPPIDDGTIAISADRIVGVGSRQEIVARYPGANIESFPQAAIIPGLINTHTHLELTAMRGYLENEETDFFAWLRKLTLARLERMTADDVLVSATWGALEAVRAGITAVGDASDGAAMSTRAIRQVGLRGIVFQESFGPDARLAKANFESLKTKVAELRPLESDLVRVGVSPHAPYTVCAKQLEMIAQFALEDDLPLMMHAAESAAEESFLRSGNGMFADSLAKRSIEWSAPGTSTIQYLKRTQILDTKPLLAHCIRVDEQDLETLLSTGSKVAHCPKSNAKLGHGRAPFARFLQTGIDVGLGSDSVASNNTCDLLEEARFAILFSRLDTATNASQALAAATVGGAKCLGLSGETGELKEGTLADFAVVSLAGTHQIPIYDPVVAAIYSTSGRDVLMTVVAGREIYREGKVDSVDEERLRHRMTEIAQKLT